MPIAASDDRSVRRARYDSAMDYTVRRATAADQHVIGHHRSQMFREIGAETDYAALEREFERWLPKAMVADVYHGWIAETAAGDVAAGGGLTVVSWPPAPADFGDRVAFIYNMYTEPPHRRQGLARRLMLMMHEWCRAQGIHTVRLHASAVGRPLYESLGYQGTNEMMMRMG